MQTLESLKMMHWTKRPRVARIQSDRFYLLEAGISTGRKARNDRISTIGEYTFDPAKTYRLRDGHHPAYCPIVGSVVAASWLRLNPFQYVEEEGTK
jgi:hypothetical protein